MIQSHPQIPGLPEAMASIFDKSAQRAIEQYIPDSDWLFDAVKQGAKEAIKEWMEENPTAIGDAIYHGTKDRK